MIPAVRTIQAFRTHALELFQAHDPEGTGVARVDFGVRQAMVIGDPAIAIGILTSPAFGKGDQPYGPFGTFPGFPVLRGLVGPALPALDGEIALARRRHLHPVFGGVMERHGVVAARTPVRLSPPAGDLYAIMGEAVFTRFCDVMFGHRYPDEASEVVDAVTESASAMDQLSKSWMPYATQLSASGASLRRCRARLLQFAERVLADLEQPWESTEPEPSMRALLDSGLAREDLLNEIVVQIAAGTETTSLTTCWALVELLRNPSYLQRLRVGEEGLATLVTKEALRMYPAFWMLQRVALEDVEVAGLAIPDRTILFVSPWVVQHNPKVWPEPERFWPERFVGRAKVRGDFLPFGYGARACIGGRLAQEIAQDCIVAGARQLDVAFVDEEPDGPRIDPIIFALKSRSGFRVQGGLRD